MDEEIIRGLFLKFSTAKLRQLSHRVSACLARLSDEEVWFRRSENDNSVANLVLHLCGNVNQWIMAGIGGKRDTRRRDEEFAARGGLNRNELSARLSAAVMQAAVVIEGVGSRSLSVRLVIQKHDVSVLEAIYHVVEHFSMHTGQIIFITKILTGKAVDFEHDLQGIARGAPDSKFSSA